MPHRGLPVAQSHCTLSKSRVQSTDMEINPMMRNSTFHARSRTTKAAKTASSSKHTSGNSGLSFGSGNPSSDSAASASWGNGILDFSSFFTSARKTRPLHSDPSKDRADPFSSSTESNSTMTSPCTTSASIDGDEEDDSGHSSAEACSMGNDNQQTPMIATPLNRYSADSSAIAERWLSMGSSSQSAAKCSGIFCYAEEEEIELSILEYSNQRRYERRDETIGWSSTSCTGTQSAQLNTTHGLFLQKLKCGGATETGTSSARYNDYPYDTSTNTSSRPRRNQSLSHYSTVTVEYTTHESSSSRGSRNNDAPSGTEGSNQHPTSEANRSREGQHSSDSIVSGMTKRNQSYDSSSDDEEKSDSDLDYEDAEEEEKLRKEAALWKTAVDPKSGRSYYYHTLTRETQWRKPLCCASVAERRATIKKEKQTLAFFASMEQNILRSMQQQQHEHSAHSKPRWNSVYEVKSPSLVHEEKNASHDRRVSEPAIQQPFKLVRTISTMEDSVLAALVQRVPSFRNLNNNATSHARYGEVGHGDSSSSFPPYAGGLSYVNDISISSLNDVAPHHVLSPIQEVSSNDSKFWSSTKSSLLLQNSKIDIKETDVGENTKDDSEDDIIRSTSREDSLQLSAVIAANRSKRRGWEESDCRFNSFEFIPEGENEDFSERSTTNHTDSSPSRGTGNGLSRQNGFINLNKVGFLLPDPIGNDGGMESSSQSPLRQSLARVGGKLSLTSESIPKETITRENSLDLACLTGGSRRLIGAPNSSSEHEASWGSYLSESAIRGLSQDEGDAMFELAAITDQMASIRSFSSSSSMAEDIQDLSENIEPGSNVAATRAGETSELDSSEHDGWISDPQLMVDKPNRRISNITSRPSMIRPTSLRHAPSRAVLESVADKKNAMEKPNILRRNTCGTLYVGSTLSAPDKDATIKCVCAVYRAHILQSSIEEKNGVDAVDYNRYRVFNDHVNLGNDPQAPATPPTLEEITLFYRDVFSRAQMESDCIIITLIYVERIIKATEGALRPCALNWRSILFSCMVMASKVWDDLSMWNADFSQTCPAGVQFELSRINELEIAVLSSLQYKVKVPASEYAKYYFLLRSMLIKSGLGSDDLKSMNPLDVEGAKQLQHVSSQYQASVAALSEQRQAAMSRSKTTGTNVACSNSIGSGNLSDSSHSGTPSLSPLVDSKHHCKVGLEHMMQL